MQNLITLFLFSLLPTIEPRYVVPFVYSKYGLMVAIIFSILSTFTLAILVAYFYDFFDKVFSKILGNIWINKRRKNEHKLQELMNRYGFIGLIIFIAVPLPLTGIWTGIIVARFLGLDKKKSILAGFIGGLISLTITLLLSSSFL